MKTLRRQKQTQKGITLVALVITIIIMLILAGVTLNIALGENGLFKMSKSAVDKYKESAQNEEKGLDEVLEDLKHIMPEDAGKEVEVPKKEKDKWDLAKVTPTADGKGNTIPVPKGFYYAGGDIDTGFVISDEKGDDLNNSKKGNQFVWIPCTAKQYTDAKDDVIDKNWSYNNEYRDNGDTGGVQKTGGTGDGKAWRDDYNAKDSEILGKTYTGANALPTSDWEKVNQIDVATESIESYGGFYIARFEAGVPSEATSFYKTVDSSDLTFNTARGSATNTGAIKNYKPVSQKGVQAWNYITQPNSKLVAENMYKGDANVGSYLVDSQAWNVICNLFNGILETSDSQRTITNSTKFGNYYNNTTTDYTKITGLWAKHGGTVTGWKATTQYETKQLTEQDRIDQTTGRSYIELPTGSSDDFEVYNIYDMAGNMWEWTTGHNVIKKPTTPENQQNPEEQMFVVPRGGSFGSTGAGNPVVRASGSVELADYSSYVGFRVVLYVK